jgi:hypothetical protein
MDYSDPRVVATVAEVEEHLTIQPVAQKHEALIAALADLIWPVIRERIKSTMDASIDDIRLRVDAAIDARIEAKIGDDLDNRIESYMNYSYDIDQKISEYMSSHFDIRDYDVNDVVEDYMNDRLDDLVYDTVSNMTFEVRVSR